MTSLAALVETSSAVAATRSRLAKTEALASLLGSLDADEIVPAVGMLTGEVRQGRLGVGWATAYRGADHDHATATPQLQILDLDRALERLALVAGPGSVSLRASVLDDLFARATGDEAVFIRQLLVGELRQGALEGVMADAIAKAAEVPSDRVRRAFMLGGRLDRAALAALSGGPDALDAIGLEVGRAIRPMLASTAGDVAEAIQAVGLASVEWKLDGARIQVHRRGDAVSVFTRNLNDITDRLPEVVAAARALPVESVVLDGETLGMGPDDRPRSFQDTMSRFGTEAVERNHLALHPWFFDCVHLDGEDLLDEPLVSRLDALERVVGPMRIPGTITDEPAVAAGVLDTALANGHEGVMVKAADSRYLAGRRGKSWLKVKPVHTFDLVVLAVEWGNGRRRGWLSNLHLGARGPDGELVMVGKTFKGMTDEMLRWQTERFSALEVRRSAHTVFVSPQQVVEIAIDGVQRSTRYPGGVALRFARVVRYRHDKIAAEADTIETLQAMLPGG